MDLAEVRGFALELMAEFGLVARGWGFGLNGVKRTVPEGPPVPVVGDILSRRERKEPQVRRG
jgi:hypothetical protein